MLQSYKTINICGVKVDIIQIPQIISFIEERIKQRRPSYIVTTNANTIVLGKKDACIREAVNKGDLSIADGYSLVFCSRFYGQPLKRRAYGPELMLEFLKVSQDKGYANFFYGSTEETLKKLAGSVKQKFPLLELAGYYSPPFKNFVQSDENEIQAINNSGADVVWVGLGGVKQERWMLEHKNKLNVPVMIGVGAAFDFLAGTKPQAPRWMREVGLEWFFRLITEPKRLWRRYLINNLLFIWYVAVDLIKKRFH